MIGARIARMGGATGDCRGGCGHESRNSWMRHPAFCARESQPRSVREPGSWVDGLAYKWRPRRVRRSCSVHTLLRRMRQVPSARDACPHVGVKRCCRLPRRDTNNRGWLCCFGFLQAIVVMWPYMEEMVTLVGRLVSHLAHRQGQETVLHAKTAAALATLFRCTPGETLLRRRVQRCAGCECATSVDTGQRFV